jgi:5-methylcytosine-specific restriction endonuclease McrA
VPDAVQPFPAAKEIRHCSEDEIMKEFAREFYSSKAWKSCREAYKKKIGGLCEECLKRGMYTPVEEIHHKIWLTPDNINDPNITLNFDNLKGLCRECHRAEHEKREPTRYTVDDRGRVTVR